MGSAGAARPGPPGGPSRPRPSHARDGLFFYRLKTYIVLNYLEHDGVAAAGTLHEGNPLPPEEDLVLLDALMGLGDLEADDMRTGGPASAAETARTPEL